MGDGEANHGGGTATGNGNGRGEGGRRAVAVRRRVLRSQLPGGDGLPHPAVGLRGGGLLLSSIATALVCLAANAGSDHVLSAMVRAEILAAHRAEGNGEVDPPATEATALIEGKRRGDLPPATAGGTIASLDIESLSEGGGGGGAGDGASDDDQDGGFVLRGQHRYEITELCHIFLNDTGLRIYGLFVALDCYGFLWAYASVFASAMAHSFPVLGVDSDYHLYVAGFALIVVPMSFLELSEQAATQVILSGCRILAIALMVATPLAAVVFGSEGAPHFDRQAGSQGAPLIDAANSYKMIPIVAYSVLFHQAVPGLADEMTDKRSIGRIFGLTFALCAVAYILIGVVVSWYFGDLVHASSNLNWAGYHGGTGSYTEDGTLVGVAWWARMISSFVVVFPAIDVLSGYPINAYVLGNSLLGFVHRGDIDRAQGDRTLTAMYRGIASVPPIVGALFVRDLGTITDFSGLTGLAIAFCFPPLLFLASERKLREHGLPSRTYYERFGSSSGGAWAILVFGLLTIVICASFLILNCS